MSMSDPVADMLTRIRNALTARHATTDVPHSRLKVAIARILREEGFISDYKVIEDRRQGVLRITLKFGAEGESVITGLAKVSKPGRRLYCAADKIPPVLSGLGINILSTSKGVLSGRVARAKRLGGELLLDVW